MVSAASGAVGSVVGQIARIKGARAVGIAGGPDKCRYVVEQLGFDACVDHRAPICPGRCRRGVRTRRAICRARHGLAPSIGLPVDGENLAASEHGCSSAMPQGSR